MATQLETAIQMVALHETAIAEILLGKTVRVGTSSGERMRTMEDLPAIRQSLMFYERRVRDLTAAAAGAPTFAGQSYSVANFSS